MLITSYFSTRIGADSGAVVCVYILYMNSDFCGITRTEVSIFDQARSVSRGSTYDFRCQLNVPYWTSVQTPNILRPVPTFFKMLDNFLGSFYQGPTGNRNIAKSTGAGELVNTKVWCTVDNNPMNWIELFNWRVLNMFRYAVVRILANN